MAGWASSRGLPWLLTSDCDLGGVGGDTKMAMAGTLDVDALLRLSDAWPPSEGLASIMSLRISRDILAGAAVSASADASKVSLAGDSGSVGRPCLSETRRVDTIVRVLYWRAWLPSYRFWVLALDVWKATQGQETRSPVDCNALAGVGFEIRK